MLPAEIKNEMIRLGMSPSKGLGQNFLTDERVAERQVGFAKIHLKMLYWK